jgi:hypothetical protein
VNRQISLNSCASDEQKYACNEPKRMHVFHSIYFKRIMKTYNILIRSIIIAFRIMFDFDDVHSSDIVKFPNLEGVSSLLSHH